MELNTYENVDNLNERDSGQPHVYETLTKTQRKPLKEETSHKKIISILFVCFTVQIILSVVTAVVLYKILKDNLHKTFQHIQLEKNVDDRIDINQTLSIIHQEPAISRSNVRLVNSSNRFEGTVEVFKNGRWESVCYNWNAKNAAIVICRMLGYLKVREYYPTTYGRGRGWTQSFHCNGRETNVDQCNNQDISWSHLCSKFVGVSCTQPLVQLVNGPKNAEGRVEVFRNGKWGTICDDGFDNSSAVVLCRMLGYRNGTAYNQATYGKGTGEIWIDYKPCNLQMATIENCKRQSVGTNNCNHSKDAGVACTGQIDVKLVKGDYVSDDNGRVEVFHDGRWGTICKNGFDRKAAAVVCRMLGYHFSVGYWTLSERGTGTIWIDNINCTGTETHIDQCYHYPWGFHNCTHSEDIEVRCSNRIEQTTVQLVNGQNSAEGRVEVFHDGIWGTICDDGFTQNAAIVVCRMLGYINGTANTDATYGRGIGKIWIDDINCTGVETNIDQCDHRQWGNHNCHHAEDAGVACTGRMIRLVNGTTPNEGRVELNYHGQWGTVCDDKWDNYDAAVVCRMLGWNNGKAYTDATYGRGIGKIWIDDIYCTGVETNIDQCDHRQWGNHNCHHSEDAGVACTGRMIRLVNGTTPNEGRVELNYHGQWGTVCDDGWDNYDAAVVCKMLGWNYGGLGLQRAHYGRGKSYTWLTRVQCTGTETDIDDCNHPPYKRYYFCDHAGVFCNGRMIRLVNGTTPNEGRVELNYHGHWGTICDNEWDDNDAAVVCRMLGWNYGGLGLQGAHYGRGKGFNWFSNVRCTGTETDIDDCNHSSYYRHSCYYGEDAGVFCNDHETSTP